MQGKPTYRFDLWRSDEEFGRQVVAGTNPVTVQAVTSLEVRAAAVPG